ncbi:HlyD family efflux transporter periplasmic adaptor subunit [Kineothrix sp. MSJ-39]|uniref:HlyD family efflux transporter periplasmic adaptor subunit n=1 Tax=Kineothrix sp. MSJ-39 TaxID=2841533 RepID=UPI001C107CB9|nr:HlyD family efflux transporter periplasmic adaptor subunit [Kineothrix sp. MSJ-39]MBU5428989.1 HlyD family efflux transporter periplasmic adaptor subunit [Kineothrix sp. MSJ-39]
MEEEKKFRKKVWIILAFVMLLCIIGTVIFMQQKKLRSTKDRKGVITQQTATVEKQDISSSISVTGTIASADARDVSASVKDVEVTAVNVSVGDYVNAGDTIVTLDSSALSDELTTAQDTYSLEETKTNKSVADAKDSIADAQDAYTEGSEEQAALVSDALSSYNEAKQTENDQKNAYEQAQEQTKKAKQAYEKLKDQKSALQKALKTAKKENEQAQQTLSEAQAAYEQAQATAKDENGNVDTEIYQAYTDAQNAAKEKEQALEQAQQAYDAIETAKNTYEQAKEAEEAAKAAYEEASSKTGNAYSSYEKSLSEQEKTNEKNEEAISDSQYNYTITAQEAANNLKSQKSQVQELTEKLGKCVVTSPISGVITSINVEEGDTYDGSTMFTVQDMSQFVVDATVDEYDIADIQKDMEAVVKTDATGDEELTGTVTYVAQTPESTDSSQQSTSSASSASYKIQITLSDTNDRLRVGMTAKTSIVLTSAKDALTLPYDCVETDADGSYYVTLEDGTKLTVEKGVESDYYVQVISDEISEGTKVQIPLSSQSDTSSSDVVSPENADFIMDNNGNMMDGGSMGGPGGGPGGSGGPGGM